MELQILLVDDDIMINLIHSKIIGSVFKDCKLFVFNNGKEVIRYIEENNNVNYLVFLDLNMPIMDGWGVLNKINQQLNNNFIQVIVVSSSIDKEDRDLAISYKFVHDYISKPLKKENLFQLQMNLIPQLGLQIDSNS